MTTTIDTTGPSVTLDRLYISIESKGNKITYPDSRTICMIDEGVKAFGQLIFNFNQPAYNVRQDVTPRLIDLEYSLEGKSQAQFQISASAYSVTDDLQFYKDAATINNHFSPIIAANLNTNQSPTNASFEQTFDYRAEMQNHSVSYIACRNPEMYPKFLRDPSFNLVFINSEVAIFKVKG
jgi:hypothetical protein